MLQVSIAEELKTRFPNLVLGCIQGKIKVRTSDDGLWKQIELLCAKLRTETTIDEIAQSQPIFQSREAYRLLGKDPTRYRLSSEALLRRVLKGKDLFKINNAVDINNLVSMVSAFSIGSYDVDKITGPVLFTVGQKGESYIGIGRDTINLENLPVFCDKVGHFGSPTSDSERVMIQPETVNIISIMISFSGQSELNNYLEWMKELFLKYAEGQEFEIQIIK